MSKRSNNTLENIPVLLIGGLETDESLIRDFLSDHGGFHFILSRMSDLDAALESLRESPEQIVLVNQVTEKARLRTTLLLLRKFPGIPVVILAKDSSPERVARALRSGAQDWLDKRILGSGLLVRTLRSAIERSRAESAFMQERNLLRSLIDNLPDRIYVKDKNFRYVLDNIAHSKFLGVDNEQDVVGKTVRDFFPPEIADRMDATDRQVLETGNTVLNREERIVDFRGEERWILVTKAPLFDRNGAVMGTVGISRDITEQRKTKSALEAANTELAGALSNLQKSHQILRDAQLQLIQAEKMQSVGRLAAGIAHEVKNPLATIRMGIDFLLSQSENADETSKSVLQEVQHAVDRADGVIRELLDFSSARQLRLRPSDFNQVISQALHLVAHTMRVGRVNVLEDLSGTLPEASMDPIKFEQALVNLLLNAAHVMEDGGTLRLRSWTGTVLDKSHDVGDRAKANLSTGAQYIGLEICDTGPGLSKEIKERLFDPFFTTKPTGKGTGLGLTVTRKIIELHGGTISLDNNVDGGACARIILPVNINLPGEKVTVTHLP